MTGGSRRAFFAMVSPSVVVHDLDLLRFAVLPDETDSTGGDRPWLDRAGGGRHGVELGGRQGRDRRSRSAAPARSGVARLVRGGRSALGRMLPPEFIGINMQAGPFSTRQATLEQARRLPRPGGRLVRLEFPETRAQLMAKWCALRPLPRRHGVRRKRADGDRPASPRCSSGRWALGPPGLAPRHRGCTSPLASAFDALSFDPRKRWLGRGHGRTPRACRGRGGGPRPRLS